MTAARGNIQRSVHEGEVGVRSLDHFVADRAGPETAERFLFGFRARAFATSINGIGCCTFGNDQCWGRARRRPAQAVASHLLFGCFAEDLPLVSRQRMEENGVEMLDPPLGLESNGLSVPRSGRLAGRGEAIDAQGIARTTSMLRNVGPPRRKA